MNLILTYVVQTLTFFLFVWFCMRYVFPPIAQMMRDREAEISEGLSAAERHVEAQRQAEVEAARMIEDAEGQAQEIIEIAKRRASELVDEANEKATQEGERIISQSRADAEVELNQAREKLRLELSGQALARAREILAKEMDGDTHAKIIDELIEQI